jgi:hypothetical protein
MPTSPWATWWTNWSPCHINKIQQIRKNGSRNNSNVEPSYIIDKTQVNRVDKIAGTRIITVA